MSFMIKKTKTIIVDSGRCSWGKCIFCSFSKKPNTQEASVERLKGGLDLALKEDIFELKYLNSGSFLDEKQIPKEFRNYFFEKCNNSGISEVVVECLPEHVTKEVLRDIKKRRKKVRVSFALGLEVADDKVLKKIMKSFDVKTYEKTAILLKKHGFGVRTYLMTNLPNVIDIKKSLEKSVDFALKRSDSIAIINTYPYGYSPLFSMWVERKWTPLDKNEFFDVCEKYENNKKVELFFDDYLTYPKFPDFMKQKIVGATSECLNHAHFDVWQEYFEIFYIVPPIKEYALFLPCAFRKPYSRSQTHKKILERLQGIAAYKKIHQIMISTPGIIPRDFESKYPFESYDWPEWEETEKIKKEYIGVTKKRVKRYLSKHKYKKIFSYFKPDSESFIALKGACAELKVPLITLLDEKMYKEIKHMNNGKTPTAILTQRRLLDSFVKVLRKNIDD